LTDELGKRSAKKPEKPLGEKASSPPPKKRMTSSRLATGEDQKRLEE